VGVNREDIAFLSPALSVGAELGVASGDLTRRFLDLSHFSAFHAVDKWNDHHNEQEYLRVVDKLKDYEELTVWRLDAKEWLKTIPDGSLGFVYIDCYAHTGQEGGAILEAAWPKLQDGGIFSGDDYDNEKYPATVDAVDRFATERRRSIRVIDDFVVSGPMDKHPSWWMRK
jgi:hypothetical protein